MGVSSVAGVGAIAGMDLTQAAYRYNQNMMEYYTCKSELTVNFGRISIFWVFYNDLK